MAATPPSPRPHEPDASAHPCSPVPPPAPLGPRWRRSRSSTGPDSTCVEVALVEAEPDGAGPGGTGPGGTGPGQWVVLLRDSKDPDGPVLRFGVDEWRAFLLGVAAGEFALPAPHCSSADRAASSAADTCGSAATRDASARASA